MKVALAQINATVGDMAGNARRLAAAARSAHAQGASLVVAPELRCAAIRPKTCCCVMHSCARMPTRCRHWRKTWPTAPGCI